MNCVQGTFGFDPLTVPPPTDDGPEVVQGVSHSAATLIGGMMSI